MSLSSSSSSSSPVVSYEYDFPERLSTRKRTRPQLFDPSPKPTTGKSTRGRPPVTGPNHRLVSLISHQGLNMTNSPHGISEALSTQARENYSIPETANHSEQQNIPSSIKVSAVANSVAKAIADIEVTNPTNATTEKVGRYVVNSNFAPILRAIINKHGDIAKECPLVSGFMRNTILEGVCKVVNELQCKQLTNIENCHFYTYFSIVKDAEAMKLDVKWLFQRLERLSEASKSKAEANKLMNESRDRTARIECLKKALQIKKKGMERLKSEIEEHECQLALETLHKDKLNLTIGNLVMKYQPFLSKCLTDGLL